MANRLARADRLRTSAPWLLAIALVATSLGLAATFRRPAPDGPGTSVRAPTPPAAEYTGPALRGVFVSCAPECDLILAVEGIARRLTFTDRTLDESAPSMSPDGARVAFRCAEPAVEPGSAAASPRPAGPGAICMLEIPTDPDVMATTTTLLASPDLDYDVPAWSPDGTAIAVEVRHPDGSSRLAVVDPRSGAVVEIRTDVGDVARPAWSPDGSTFGFACGTAPGPDDVAMARFCTMPTVGGDVTALGAVGGTCGVPTFTPDAANLGVVCDAPDLAGGDLFFLSTAEPSSRSLTASQLMAPEGARRVAFDGDRLAFVRRDDALWAVSLAGEAWSQPPLPPLHGDFDVQVLP